MPYLPETHLSRIGRRLPQSIMERGKEIRTFMPRFGCVNERRNQLHEVIRLSGLNLVIDDVDHPLIIKVASIQSARMQVYFIDNDDYFRRKSTTADANGVEHPDNDERTIFFARGVLETTKKLHWEPDLIHCSGWFTAFVPLFVRLLMKDDPHFAKSKLVLSIFDNDFYAKWDGNIQKKLYVEGIDEEALKQIHVDDYLSLMKMAIDMCDGIIQGSETINAELLEYAKQSGKPFLDYQGEENYADAFNVFYNSILD